MASSGCRRDVRRLMALASLAILPATRIAAAQETRLPASAQRLLRADIERAVVADGLVEHGVIPRGALFALRRDPGGPIRADVFVRARPGIESSLRALGARVGARAGEWVTAQVPLDRLREVSALPGVRSVEVARRARLLTDSSMLDIGATGRRRRQVADLFEDATGRGVIVGFVDSGIDFLHADFIEDDTRRSRILWLWDQTLDGSGPAGTAFTYGYECSRVELGPEGSCASRDTRGHGTHVAGIAVSDGSFRGPNQSSFPGVAPGAEMVVVKSDLSFTSIIDGVAYIFERAAQLGRPAVVNLSLGTQVGPHDGDEAASLALDALSGPGRIVVVAAGNEGNNRNLPTTDPLPARHGEGSAPAGQSFAMTFRVEPYAFQPGSGNDRLFIQAFYPPDDRYTVTVTRPNGTSVVVGTDGSASANDVAGAVVLYNGTIPGDSILGDALESGNFAPASQARVAELFVGEWVASGAAPASGVWTITMSRVSGTSTGLVDAYISEFTFPQPPTFLNGASNRKLIGSPGDARSAITVGAYSTRTGWNSIDGGHYIVSLGDSVATGDLLPFSSPGPTRDGRVKPDIAAPGRVFSTLTATATFPQALIAPDGGHLILEGTSMSTPHVTGAVALLLSRRPTLTPQQALTALTSSARRDAFTALVYSGPSGVPNNSWGWGKLNVPGSIDAVPALSGRAFVSIRAGSTKTFSSARGTLIPLQAARFSATDAESLSVARLGVRVNGNDRNFRLAAVIDSDRDGEIDANEPIVARSAPFDLHSEQDALLAIASGALVIPRGGVADIIVAAELSGFTPNGAVFTGMLLPQGSITQGLVTGASKSLTGESVAPPVITTSVLRAGERVAISQNPVRRGPLIINVGEAAQRIEIYDFAGRRVRAISPTPAERSLQWNLLGDDGRLVPNGTYIMVVRLGSGVVRQKLFVAQR